MANFYPSILKWTTSTIANGETMSTTLAQLESNDNYLLGLIGELKTDDGTISYIVAVNNTASTIVKGTPVYVSGVVGDKIGIAPANNTTQQKSTVIGLVLADIEPSAEGQVMLSGIISDLDTSSFTAGSKIYLGSADGSFTTTEPISPAHKVSIGNIINSDSTSGKLFVDITASFPDYKVKVSDNDSTPSFIDNKITVDETLEKNVSNDGGNENIELSSKGFIKVDDDDTDKSTWSTLIDSIDAGSDITLEIVEVSGKRKVRISSTGGSGEGDITGSGTINRFSKFIAEKEIGDTRVSEDSNGNIIIGSSNNSLGVNDIIIGDLNNRVSEQNKSVIIGSTNTDEGSENITIGKDNNVTGTSQLKITVGRGNTTDGDNNVTIGLNNYSNDGIGDRVVVGKNITVDETIDADVHIGGSKVQLHGQFIDKNGVVADDTKILGFDSTGEPVMVDSVNQIWQKVNDVISPIDSNDELNVQVVDYKISSMYPQPLDKEGRTYYNPNTNTLIMNPTDDDKIEMGRSLFVRGINNSGSTITAGSLVYFNNNDVGGFYPTFTLANVVTLTSCHNVGVLVSDTDNGDEAEIQTYGLMKGFNTSDFEVTDIIYLNELGQYSTTAPTSPYIPMIAFTVLKKDATDGWIYINPKIGYNTSSGTSFAFQAKGKVTGFDTIVNDAIYDDYESFPVNVGSAFNETDGKFTVQTDGIYTFTASALIDQNNTVNPSTCNMYIKRFNSSDVEQESVQAFATSGPSESNGYSISATAIFDCVEGDYVVLVFALYDVNPLYVNKVLFSGFSLTGLKGDQGPIGLTGPTGVTNISEADDVTITSILANDILTWDGTQWVNTRTPQLDVVKINTEAQYATELGAFTWDDTDKTVSLGLEGGSALQLGQEMLVYAVNQSGSTITNGQPVYISGASGNRVVVSLAQAVNAPTTQVALAVATQTIANNGSGYFTCAGLVRAIDTSAWTEGDIIYVSTTAGALTNVAPSKPYSQLAIGVVVRSHATTGSIFVKPYVVPRISQLTDVNVTGATDGQVLGYQASSGLWIPMTGGGSGTDTYQFKLNAEDTTAGFFADKVDVADGSPLSISYTDGKAVFDIIEEDVSDPLIKTVSLLSESGANTYTGSCWSSTFADGEWATGTSQNTTDDYYRVIPDARGTISKVTVYIGAINGEDAYYGTNAGAIRIGLFDAAGVLKGSTPWTRGITTLGTHTFNMTAESGQNLTLERNTTYWIAVVARGLDLISYNKANSGLNLTTLRYSVRIRNASNNANWSDFLTSGTGYTENKISIIQMSAT